MKRFVLLVILFLISVFFSCNYQEKTAALDDNEIMTTGEKKEDIAPTEIVEKEDMLYDLWADGDSLNSEYNSFVVSDDIYIYYCIADGGKYGSDMIGNNTTIYRVSMSGGVPEIVATISKGFVSELRQNEQYLYFRHEGDLKAIKKDTFKVLDVETKSKIWHRRWPRVSQNNLFYKRAQPYAEEYTVKSFKYEFDIENKINIPVGDDWDKLVENWEELDEDLVYYDSYGNYDYRVEKAFEIYENQIVKTLVNAHLDGEISLYTRKYKDDIYFLRSVYSYSDRQDYMDIIKFNLETKKYKCIFSNEDYYRFYHSGVEINDNNLYLIYLDQLWESFDFEKQFWSGKKPGVYCLDMNSGTQNLIIDGYVGMLQFAGDWIYFDLIDPRPTDEDVGLSSVDVGVYRVRKDGSDLQAVSEIITKY